MTEDRSAHWRKSLAKAAAEAPPAKLAIVTPITAAPSYLGRQWDKK